MANRPMVKFYGTYLSASGGSRLPSESIAEALRTHGFLVEMVSSSPLMPVRGIQWLWHALTPRNDVAVVEVFSSRVVYVTNIVTRLIARRRIPIIAILQGGGLLERFAKIEFALRPILDSADWVISPSKFLTDGFNGLGFRVENIPNPLKLEEFPYLERDQPTNTIRLLWVRAFAEIYRPHWPVEIVWHLLRRDIPCQLTMVGPDKGLLADVKARARKLGVVENIDFAGPVSNQKLFKYYHSHDYFLNTTKFESFGMALVEAAATGLPIVSAAVGEVNYSWKDEEDIFLVHGRTSEEFADRIADLRETDRDGAKYRLVSRTARAKVAEFSLQSIIPRWENMIRQVCDGRSN